MNHTRVGCKELGITNLPPKGEEKVILMAALLAMGTNIGLTKIADATSGVTYHQMANAAQW